MNSFLGLRVGDPTRRETNFRKLFICSSLRKNVRLSDFETNYIPYDSAIRRRFQNLPQLNPATAKPVFSLSQSGVARQAWQGTGGASRRPIWMRCVKSLRLCCRSKTWRKAAAGKSRRTVALLHSHSSQAIHSVFIRPTTVGFSRTHSR